MTFECGRLKELAGYFPDLSEHLLNIFDHIKDLVVPFRSGWYYNKRMGGTAGKGDKTAKSAQYPKRYAPRAILPGALQL